MKKAILITMVLAIGLSTELAKADFTFGEPTNLGASVNSSNYDAGPSISSDGLSLFFYSLRSGGFGGSGWERLDLWVSTRETTTGDWETPTDLGSTVNSSTMDGTPCISSDGLSLFFDSWRSGGSGQSDIWMTTRATIYDPWGTPVNLGTMVNSSASDIGPCISADGLELYFGSDRTGGSGDWDIWITRRATVSDAWGPAENLGSTVNSPVYDGLPAISPDGLLLFITSLRSGGYGDNDIWVAKRVTRDGEWGEPVNLGPMVNTSAGEAEPSISYDGRWLYFDDYTTMRSGGIGGPDLWKVPIVPIVDLNGDGIVDAADMCIIVDNWGTDNKLCDVGPMPWGDGVVDVEDLKVLAKHLFEVYPSAETVDVNETDNGGQVEVELGKLLVVTLESNPSTGYQWELIENNESILKQFGEVEFKSSDTGDLPMVGAGGWDIFRFKAVSAGQTTLEFVYHRSWEDAEPLKTFSIQVTVN